MGMTDPARGQESGHLDSENTGHPSVGNDHDSSGGRDSDGESLNSEGGTDTWITEENEDQDENQDEDQAEEEHTVPSSVSSATTSDLVTCLVGITLPPYVDREPWHLPQQARHNRNWRNIPNPVLWHPYDDALAELTSPTLPLHEGHAMPADLAERSLRRSRSGAHLYHLGMSIEELRLRRFAGDDTAYPPISSVIFERRSDHRRPALADGDGDNDDDDNNNNTAPVLVPRGVAYAIRDTSPAVPLDWRAVLGGSSSEQHRRELVDQLTELVARLHDRGVLFGGADLLDRVVVVEDEQGRSSLRLADFSLAMRLRQGGWAVTPIPFDELTLLQRQEYLHAHGIEFPTGHEIPYHRMTPVERAAHDAELEAEQQVERETDRGVPPFSFDGELDADRFYDRERANESSSDGATDANSRQEDQRSQHNRAPTPEDNDSTLTFSYDGDIDADRTSLRPNQPPPPQNPAPSLPFHHRPRSPYFFIHYPSPFSWLNTSSHPLSSTTNSLSPPLLAATRHEDLFALGLAIATLYTSTDGNGNGNGSGQPRDLTDLYWRRVRGTDARPPELRALVREHGVEAGNQIHERRRLAREVALARERHGMGGARMTDEEAREADAEAERLNAEFRTMLRDEVRIDEIRDRAVRMLVERLLRGSLDDVPLGTPLDEM